MIWYYLILFVGSLLSAVLGAFHVPLVTTLPFGMDGALTSAMGYFYFIEQNVPSLAVIFNCAMVYISFKGLIFALKQFRIYKE